MQMKAADAVFCSLRWKDGACIAKARHSSAACVSRAAQHCGLAELLGVSPGTVRRDLAHLAAQRLCQETYGAAVALALAAMSRLDLKKQVVEAANESPVIDATYCGTVAVPLSRDVLSTGSVESRRTCASSMP